MPFVQKNAKSRSFSPSGQGKVRWSKVKVIQSRQVIVFKVNWSRVGVRSSALRSRSRPRSR